MIPFVILCFAAGIVIAENQPSWELVAIGEEIDNLQETLRALEKLNLIDASEHNALRDLIRSHRGFELVKFSNLTEEQAATLAVRRHRFGCRALHAGRRDCRGPARRDRRAPP